MLDKEKRRFLEGEAAAKAERDAVEELIRKVHDDDLRDSIAREEAREQTRVRVPPWLTMPWLLLVDCCGCLCFLLLLTANCLLLVFCCLSFAAAAAAVAIPVVLLFALLSVRSSKWRRFGVIVV